MSLGWSIASVLHSHIHSSFTRLIIRVRGQALDIRNDRWNLGRRYFFDMPLRVCVPLRLRTNPEALTGTPPRAAVSEDLEEPQRREDARYRVCCGQRDHMRTVTTERKGNERDIG